MLGKLLEWWLHRYYSKGVRFRSVLLVQGEKNDTLVKVCGTKKNLRLNLYVAMIRDEDIREIVLQASELYRETEDDPMEYMRKLFELNKRSEETSE